MSNLPINWEDKKNSPALLAYLQQFGEKSYLSAEEINQLRDAINELGQSSLPDAVLKSGTISITGLAVNIAANAFAWRINKQEFFTPAAYGVNLTAAADGYYRADIIVGTSTGTYQIIQGNPSTTSAIEPDAPDGTIRLAGVVVFGLVVGTPTPTPTTNFVEKSERANVILTSSGVINMLTLVDEKATIVFKGTVTILNTITYNSVPYNGKRITLFNAQNTPVTIGNSVSGYGVDFVFPDGQDYVLQPNQTIEFSFDITYAPYAHHMFIGDRNTIAKDDLAYYDLSLNYGGGNGPETLNTNKSNIRIVADISGNGGIEGFIFGAGYQPYDGKIFTITNNLLFPVYLSPPFFKSVEKFLDSGLTMAFIYDNNSGNPIFRQLSAIEPVDRQIQVGSGNSVIPASFNKKTILFSENATITVPSTLPDEFSFVFRTLAGVTVTWAITAPFTWETTPSTTPEKTTGSFMRRGSTNTILLDF
jgi:hypothetical protein